MIVYNRAAIKRQRDRINQAKLRDKRKQAGLCIYCRVPPKLARHGLVSCQECYDRVRPKGQRRKKPLSAKEKACIRRDYGRRGRLIDRAFEFRERAKLLEARASQFTMLSLARRHKCHPFTIKAIIEGDSL